MLSRNEQNRHEELILECLGVFEGTPEQFGSLLYTATQTLSPFGWSETANIQFRQWAREKHAARHKIAGMPNGAELLRLEEKSLR